MGTKRFTVSGRVNGVLYQTDTDVTHDNGGYSNSTLAAAKAGTLSTRTNNTDGELTMTVGHGIITANLIDIFWFNADGTLAGARRGVVVGTVATNAVPISGGTGDNLPVVTTAIKAMVQVTEEIGFTGNNARYIVVKSPRPGFVIIKSAADAVLLAVAFTGISGGSYIWYIGSGVTNPLAGVVPAKVTRTHSDSTAAQTPSIEIGYN